MVGNMIDYLPIEPFQLGAVCNLLLLIKKRVYIRPWGLEQRMNGCNVWVQPIVRLHSVDHRLKRHCRDTLIPLFTLLVRGGARMRVAGGLC